MSVGALFLNQTLCRKFNGSNLTAFKSAKISVCIQLELCVYEFTGRQSSICYNFRLIF